MNAGFTKIYALLASNFIIYDGRVGAALGYLVTLFLEHSGDDLANDLQFHWGKSESKERYRDPSIVDKGWIFQKLNNNREDNWAESNVKANWLLSSAIEMLPSSFIFGGYKKENMLHAVEASLFMLGYDFPNLKPQKKVREQHHEQRITPKNTKVTADKIRSFALQLVNHGLKRNLDIEFTSSDLRKELGGDLTAICSAMKKLNFFSQNGIFLEVVDAPKKGVGRVTYRGRNHP